MISDWDVAVPFPARKSTMASSTNDPKAGKARVFFRYGGRRCNRMAKVKSERAAQALCETIDQTIADLDRGGLTLPQAPTWRTS